MPVKPANASSRVRLSLLSPKAIAWWGLALTIALPIIVVLLLPAFVEYFNAKLYDVLLLHLPHKAHNAQIAIIDVDEKSLQAHGQWPWPRYKIAAILEKLHHAGVAAIGIDMVFPEKDRTSLSAIRADLRQNLGIAIDFIPADACADNDLFLADAISQSPAVLGYQFVFESTPGPSDCRLHPLQLEGRSSHADQSFLWQAAQVICNLKMFAENAQASGFFNVAPDADGILRRVPMVVSFHNRLYPSLALATVMKAFNIDRTRLNGHFQDYNLILGQSRIPLDARGTALVRYRGKGNTYPYISAADLLSGNFEVSGLKDKIVFLGTTAAGLKEFRSTPTDPIFPGVEVHATVADNLLSADFLARPAYAPGLELIVALLGGVVYVFVIRRAGALRNLIFYLCSSAALLLASFSFFNSEGIYFSPILPLVVLTTNFTLLNLLHFWREELRSRQRERDLALAQGAIIESMAAFTETRDRDTGGHIKRTQEYVRLLAEALRKDPAYSGVLNNEMIELIYRSAPLHDIGKVGISDRILLKAGDLTKEEYEEIKKHAIIGKELIEGIQKTIGNQPFIEVAHDLTHSHHEKWDGSGYPQGLKGDQIPLCGRIMAIADMYDALASRRAYKEPMTHEVAVQVMTDCAVKSFDPLIFKTFLRIQDEFKKVSLNLS